MAKVKRRRKVVEKVEEPIIIEKKLTWGRDLLAVLCLMLAGFFILAIASHTPATGKEMSSSNLMGPIGYLTSTLFRGFFGWSSLIFSVWLITTAIFFWSTFDDKWNKKALSVGLLFNFVSVLALTSIVWGVEGGGDFGNFLHKKVAYFFGTSGSIIFYSVLFLVSLALSFQKSTWFIISNTCILTANVFVLCLVKCKDLFLKVIQSFSLGKTEMPVRSYTKELEHELLVKPRSRKNKVEIVEEDEEDEQEESFEDEAPTHVVVERRRQQPAKKVVVKTRKFDNYKLPEMKLLTQGTTSAGAEPDDLLLKKSRQIEEKLKDFGVNGKITFVHPGPVVTLFEFEPAAGVKVGKVASLQDDLAMSLKATAIRIIAPIPKRGTVGIEVPNTSREMVQLRDILESSDFQNAESILSIALGKDVYGSPVVIDIATMPHLLMAGSTGTGKSVSINTILISLLYRANPEELGLIMIDPKVLELSVYEGIPHLKVPVVTVPKQARAVLLWAVQEMDRRYRMMQKYGVRNIDGYNKIAKGNEDELEADEVSVDLEDLAIPREEIKPLPKILIVVDELADLMMTVGKEIEELIARLAQKARAAGIHLLLATQRPSVDVITGLIKANFPARLSFRVSSRIDSRTILDSMGAERLLGKGDSLLMLPGETGQRRVHGAYISDEEVNAVVAAIKSQSSPNYDQDILSACEKLVKESDGESGGGKDSETEYDELYDQSVQLVIEKSYASTSMIQRAFRIGYNRAARIIDTMEREGVIGPMDGAKPREVLVNTTSDI